MATHNSPKGRPVEMVEGNGEDVSDRGQQIMKLGEAMSEASALLDRLVDFGADMEGNAVDKLREAGGKVNHELSKASSLYVDVGPYVKNYGDALAGVISALTSIVPDAEEYWKKYQARLDDLEQAQNAPVASGEDDPDGTAQQDHDRNVDDAVLDKSNAYDLWKSAADDFDAQYDKWEDAFDTAVAGVKNSTSDAIHDSWKDNLDGFVRFALKVLAVAGLVLAVLALVVGGPIVALLALAVGALTLIGTLWQYSRGDASGWDVALAVVGVIPFGAFGEFASGGFGAGMRAWGGLSRGGLSVGDDFARWSLSLGSKNPAQWVSNMRGLGPEAGYLANSFDDIATTVISGQDPGMWEVITKLGTAGEQAVYGLGSAGAHYQNILTGYFGVTGAISIAGDPKPLLWPTW
ncbi:hypothetical protein GCM10022240_15860 [Microbacterium kribbense]|uniref:WXG100 family type VII secretion target n=1 Tax=Microbacterium kribbense TaxID=433645 RepID=A0ABP7GI00_9MICO